MTWQRIRGQDAARNIFTTAVAYGRLGQAYLLVGPDGIGKRLFAYELAKALLCEQSPGLLTACDHCPGCAQVGAETHPDLLLLRTPDDKHELPVADMRAFCARLALKPVRGPGKIGIVADADDFNDESANAFLKTLEEPPPRSLLLLIATDTDRQLPTILSRCQVVRLTPLSDADIITVLADHGIQDPTQRQRLARLAGGSVARALALNNESIWQVRQTLLEGIMSPRPNFLQLVETWSRFYEDAGKDTAAQRLRVSLVLKFLIETVQTALKASLGVAVPGLSQEEAARLQEFATRLGPDMLMELLEKCVEADLLVERRVQLILIVESVLEKFLRTTAL